MRVIAFFMAAALLLAGCAEDKPREPKASAAPTVTVPTMPAAAEKNSEAGAIAFVKHYIDVFNYASNTGDVKELQKLFESGCKACRTYLDTIESAHANGADVDGFDWTVSNLVADQGSTFNLAINSGKYRTRDTAHSEWTEVLAAKYELVVELSRREGGWLVAELYLPGKEGT